MAPSFSSSSALKPTNSSCSSSSSTSLVQEYLILSIKLFKPLVSSLKLKSTFIFPHLHRIIARPAKALVLKLQLAKFPPLITNILKLKLKHNSSSISWKLQTATSNKKEAIFGSFRLHYNWCSSHKYKNVVMPLEVEGEDIMDNGLLLDDEEEADEQLLQEGGGRGREADEVALARYLEWLEKREEEWIELNEIDKLADMFIANCHEKFRLEKQESYRRFQEMMARSV